MCTLFKTTYERLSQDEQHERRQEEEATDAKNATPNMSFLTTNISSLYAPPNASIAFAALHECRSNRKNHTFQ